jgi:hypothetical protein
MHAVATSQHPSREPSQIPSPRPCPPCHLHPPSRACAPALASLRAAASPRSSSRVAPRVRSKLCYSTTMSESALTSTSA